MTYFVERLTLWSSAMTVLPYLLRRRFQKRAGPHRCYVLEGSPMALAVIRALTPATRVSFEPCNIRLWDVRDLDGCLSLLTVTFQDLAKVLADIMADPVFSETVRRQGATRSLRAYLAKAVVLDHLPDRTALLGALLIVHICAWKMRGEPTTPSSATLFLDQRPWLSAVQHLASRVGIELVGVRAAPTLRACLGRCLSLTARDVLRTVRDRLAYLAVQRRLKAEQPMPHRGSAQGMSAGRPQPSEGHPRLRLAVEYCGHLNLDHPERYSDLSFWQRSTLSARDMLVTFSIVRDPLDEAKQDELQEHGIEGIVLNPRAAAVPGVRTFLPRRHRWGWRRPAIAPRGGASKPLEQRWLQEQIHQYDISRAYWTEFFERERVKVHLSWYQRYDPVYCAMVDAVREMGGVSAVYQRSYQEFPMAKSLIVSDVAFGFSPKAAEVERGSGSAIQYHVATGYLGDHRFALLRQEAKAMRQRLQRHGASHVMAFFDENSSDDPRWGSGHSFTRENYAFLLEKVLTESWFGLLLKPKIPSTLRKRLDPVVPMLERALATGRCVLYERGALHGSYPPAAAALASDLAVHGHLFAATAGIEAALAGVPTLLMDRDGWPVSSFYRLGVGRVVFNDWPTLWKACREHWHRPGGTPGFGDWSSILDELDPFRDGRAAQRMGTYLQWLLDGFRAGLSRETVMADAAQRYSALWGKDKITSVNVDGAWRADAPVPAGSPGRSREGEPELVGRSP